jgi:dUTP pyrophosphatase
MTVKIKLLNENAKILTRALEDDACYDVVATSRKDLGDGRIQYGLGIAMEIPENTQADFRARSSIHKTGLILSNSIGTIDEGYRGEIGAVFYHIISTLQSIRSW